MKIAFIGLGLIGGSIAMAIREKNPDARIVAYNRSSRPLVQAMMDGIIDVATSEIDESFKDCDYIFLCAPVQTNISFLSKIKPYITENTILTDVGSTKGNIHKAVIKLVRHAHFIGGHPMAGKEKSSYFNASSELIRGCYYFLTPSGSATTEDVSGFEKLVRNIGCNPIIVDPDKHDFIVGAISHVPHMAAYMLVKLVKDDDTPEEYMRVTAAGGFKDITRVASSDPTMWSEICLANKDNILKLMDEYIDKLKGVRELIAKEKEEALYDLFSEAREYRNSIVRSVRIGQSKKGYKGEMCVPGDKSISHRAVMFGAIAEGTTHISGFLNGADCISTINCFRQLGVRIDHDGGTEVTVHGVGLKGLKKPSGVLDCGNSGTTTRLISGILAGQSFSSTVTGDASVRRRPMKRIMSPLINMGADIVSLEGNDCAPLKIRASSLHGICHESKIASAQVKSAVLLAGLYADGDTTVTEPALSRDYTELMLASMGADITRDGLSVTLHPGNPLKAQDITIPGDISSAAYFMGAALIVEGSDLVIKNTGVNPTRAGIIEVFKSMGGSVNLENERIVAGERVADIHVKSSSLHGTEISGAIIPTLIDELPLIAVVASIADGTTIIKDAAELKVKESDRIELVTKNLKAMGAEIEASPDGFIINSSGTPNRLHGIVVDDSLDHRIAMSFAIAGLVADGETEIIHPECVSISYPGFFDDLTSYFPS